jgi:uncharacterized protein (DUF924 family)
LTPLRGWPGYRDVLEFWFGNPADSGFGTARASWFGKNASFDARIREHFGATWDMAARGRLGDWREDPLPLLAFIVLTDQFPRNMFRGTSQAFATDGAALAAARVAVSRGYDAALSPVQRLFVYLPFEHAEDLVTQRESLRLFARLGEYAGSAGAVDFARRHHDIVARYGRFPHRNAMLGRKSTAAEAAFLLQPGSGF